LILVKGNFCNAHR